MAAGEAALPPQRRGHVRRAARTRGAGGDDRDVLGRVPAGDGGAERDARRPRRERVGALGHRPRYRRRPRARDRQRAFARRDRGRAREPAGLDRAGRRRVDRARAVRGAALAAGRRPGRRAARAVRVLRRRGPARDHGRVGQLGAGGRRAARRWIVAAARVGRVRARLSRRGHARRSAAPAAERAGGPARPLGDVRGLPQAPPGRGAVPARLRDAAARFASWR